MENADGIGTVTPAMVEARARELARINGHGSKPTKADYQQANRELTGEEEIDPQEQNLEATPESESWDPVPGSTGRQAADSLGEMKMPRDEARRGRCTKKASMKPSTIKCVAQPRRSRAMKANSRESSVMFSRTTLSEQSIRLLTFGPVRDSLKRGSRHQCRLVGKNSHGCAIAACGSRSESWAMKASCCVHSQTGGALCGLFV